MNNKFLLLFFIAFFTTVSFAQIQVSDIQHFRERDDYPIKGFIKFENDEYFINQGAEGTKIYLVTESGLELKHDLNYRPTDSSLNVNASSYANSNSGLIYEDELLFELYWSYIYVTNIVTGELHEVIDLREQGIRLQSSFVLGKNFMYFNALDCEQSCKIRYDRNTKEFLEIDKPGIRIKEGIYNIVDSINTISYYDLGTNEETNLSENFSNIRSMFSLYVSGIQTLLVKDDNGLSLFQNGALIEKKECNIPDSLKIRSINNDQIVCSNNVDEYYEVLYYDANSCERISIDKFYDIQPYAIINYNFQELDDKFLLFGNFNDWQGIGNYYLLNVETGEYNKLTIPMDFLYSSQLVMYNDKLHFIVADDIHYLGIRYGFYEIDLTTLSNRKIDDFSMEETYQIVIGESQDDESINVYFNAENKKALYNYKSSNNELIEVEEFDYTENQGIFWDINADIWSQGKYFFSTSESIFVMQNDEVVKLIEEDSSQVFITSAFKENGNFVYVLAYIDDTYYSLKINVQDLSYTQEIADNVEFIHFERATTENSIVNLNHSSAAGYYDTDWETYLAFSEVGLPSSRPQALSGNNILLRESGGSNDTWNIHNTVTKQTLIADIEPQTYQDAFPDGLGGFYFSGWQFAENASLFYINGQGQRTTLEENFSHFLFRGGNRMDGEIKSLAFDGEEDMIIFSTNGQTHEIKNIPDGGLAYYQTVFWDESDNRSILELFNGESYNTYHFSFGTAVTSILENRDDRMIMIFEEEGREILVFKDNNHLITFYEYDYNSQELTELLSLQSVLNFSHSAETYKLDDSIYLIQLNDGIHGLEPWIFNSQKNTIHLLKDMNENFTPSYPKDFTEGPDNTLYFTAHTKTKDRQLFKLDEALLSNTNTEPITEESLIVFPSPSNGQIQLFENHALIQIYNLKGQLVHSESNYQGNEQINVSHLGSSVFIIRATSESGESRYAKIKVVRE